MLTPIFLASLIDLIFASITVVDLDHRALTALSNLHEENRSRFDSGVIEFTYVDGHAKTLTEAKSGALSDSHQAIGSYSYQNENGKYERVFSTESMAATTKKSPRGSLIKRFATIRMLTNGRLTLHDEKSAMPNGTIYTSNIIRPGAQDFFKLAEIPFDLGVPAEHRDDLPQIARRIHDGASNLKLEAVDEGANLDGVATVRLDLQGPYGKRTIWIDPERAAIPILVHDEMPDGSTHDLHHGDIRLVPGRGWLPFERTVLLSGGRVKRVLITKVDFGNVPADAFRLDFPEPTPMVNAADGVSYPARTSWDLSKLPAAHAPGVIKVISVAPPAEPAMPGEREPTRPYFTIVALAISIVLAILWFRRRGRMVHR